jgi:hypothetical protein
MCIAGIELDTPVSGEAALAALPSCSPVWVRKLFICLGRGLNADTGEWENLQAGLFYRAFSSGYSKFANRQGALNDIEFSEFVVKAQTTDRQLLWCCTLNFQT